MNTHVSVPSMQNPFGHVVLELGVNSLFLHYMPKTGLVMGSKESIYLQGGLDKGPVKVNNVSSLNSLDDVANLLQPHFKFGYGLLFPEFGWWMSQMQQAGGLGTAESAAMLKGVLSLRNVFSVALRATEVSANKERVEVRPGLVPVRTEVVFTSGGIETVLKPLGHDFVIIITGYEGKSRFEPIDEAVRFSTDYDVSWDLFDNSCAIRIADILYPGFRSNLKSLVSHSVSTVTLSPQEEEIVKLISGLVESATA